MTEPGEQPGAASAPPGQPVPGQEQLSPPQPNPPDQGGAMGTTPDTPLSTAASQADTPAGPLPQEGPGKSPQLKQPSAEPAETQLAVPEKPPATQASGTTPPPPRRLDEIRAADIARKSKGRASIEEQREDVREYLARSLLRMLAFTIFLGVALIATRRWTQVSEEETHLFFQVAFTAVIALVSAATGFYFGSDRRDPPDNE